MNFSLSTASQICITILLTWLIWRYLTIVRVKYKANEEATPIIIGHAPPTPSTIPRIIWSYWHNPIPSTVVALCFKNWRRYAPDHELRVLNEANILEYFTQSDVPENFEKLEQYRRADWLRAALLHRHGGIWLDASTILTTSLEWVHQLHCTYQGHYVGYYIERLSSDQQSPVIENWFMAAPSQSIFIGAWKKELERAVVENNESTYLADLQHTGAYMAAVQKIKTPQYLIMHVAATHLLNKHQADYRLVLKKAEDSALFYLAHHQWKKRRLYVSLALYPCPQQLPALIKLRGGERQMVEKYLRRGWLLKRSAIGTHLF